MRESLVACKELLHYKRDELKKLWLDGVEQKHVLQLLQQVQGIKELPEKISGQLARKEFLIATRGITESLKLLSGTLKDVEALAEVRTELETRQAQLYTRLLEDLTGQLYEVSVKLRLSSILSIILFYTRRQPGMCFSCREQAARGRTRSSELAAVERHLSGKILSQARWRVGEAHQKVGKMGRARPQGRARRAAGERLGNS